MQITNYSFRKTQNQTYFFAFDFAFDFRYNTGTI